MLDSGLDINGMFNEWEPRRLQKQPCGLFEKRSFYLAQQRGGAWSIFM